MNRNETMDTVDHRPDGYFTAERSDGVVVKGVASDEEAAAELLRRAGVPRRFPPTFTVRPNTQVHDARWTQDASNTANDVYEGLRAQLAHPPAGLVSTLTTIGESLPHGRRELADLARRRASDLNANEPQADFLRVYYPPFDANDTGAFGIPDAASRGFARWAGWVDSRLIASTQSHIWNDIDRTPRRDSVVDIAEGLHLAAATGALDAWLAEMFDSRTDPVLLRQVQGPAGPVYATVVGTHRTHAAKIWEIPAILANVLIDTLPQPVVPRGRIEVLWHGLQSRGLISASVSDGVWYLERTVGDWLLAPPDVATSWNAAYERAYPGALQQATRLTHRELTDPRSWVDVLRRGM